MSFFKTVLEIFVEIIGSVYRTCIWWQSKLGKFNGEKHWIKMKNTDCTFRATLRIDLVDWADEHRFAQYERVKIGHEKRWYKVSFGVCPFLSPYQTHTKIFSSTLGVISLEMLVMHCNTISNIITTHKCSQLWIKTTIITDCDQNSRSKMHALMSV